MAISVIEKEIQRKLKRIDPENVTHRVYECPICGNGRVYVENSVFYGRCNSCDATVFDFEPLSYQMDFLLSDATYILLIGGFGCMAPESKVLMYDGTIKEHKDIKVGDKLMGVDSTPRTVLEVHSGTQPRYAVKFEGYDKPLYFNEEHEFYLRNWTYKYKGDGSKHYRRHLRDEEDIFIKVKDYNKTTKRFKKDNLWIFPEMIEFKESEVPLDPYKLGLLLGDGSFRTSKPYFSNIDKELLDEFEGFILNRWVDKRNGLVTISLNSEIEDKIKQLGLWGTNSESKFIPEEYIINSSKVRLELLAGLIDTDGSAKKGYEITLKSEQMVDDIVRIAKSLGMKATKNIKRVNEYPDKIYYRVHLSGNNVDKIPVKLERKKLNLNANKRHNIRAFSVEKVGDNEPYVGFTVDKDNLYIEGEHFSVVKNSGKTTISCFDDVYHALTVPNARILITAPTLQQMKAAILPELEKFTPPWFLEGGRAKGNPPMYKFTNGSEIYIYASDDEQKMRSLNLTRFHIEEGSGVDKSIFDQLQARLRNRAAVIYDEHGREIGNKFKGIVSTNPEDSWIKDEFLLKSKKLHGSPSVDVSIYEPLMHHERVDLFESFISASFDNYKLPKGTIERISAGKSDKWKRKYLWSYLDSREGLVYDFTKHFVEPFEIPRSWKRIGGYDPGISDPTAALIGAIDPNTNTIYFYAEYYAKNKSVTEHGQALRPLIDGYSWLHPIAADPSVNKRSQETGVPYRTYFKQQTGITLMPVNNDILVGIDKVRDYLHNNKIKFFNNLVELKREGSLYSFPTPEDTKNFKNTNNKPYDKDNHLMDALRYAIMPLPENPNSFKAIVSQQEIYDTNVFNANKLNGRGVTYGFKRGG